MISTLVYRDNTLSAQNPPADSLAVLKNEHGVMLWIDLSAPGDEETRLVLETAFSFDPLAIEDCKNAAAFPKAGELDNCLHVVMHAVSAGEQTAFNAENLVFFIGKNFLVTFHQAPFQFMDAVRERLIKTPSLAMHGPDWLAHTILDRMADDYKPALETLRHQTEEIGEMAMGRVTSAELFPRIVETRRKFSRLRQIVKPQRAVAAELARGNSVYIRGATLPYLRDLEEELERTEAQTVALSEQLIVTFRVFLNKSNHEANAGIRVMTAITALTFPTLLIGSWYGMNFTRMPELHAHHGYVVAALVMLFGTLGAWGVMAWKKWL